MTPITLRLQHLFAKKISMDDYLDSMAKAEQAVKLSKKLDEIMSSQFLRFQKNQLIDLKQNLER